MLGEHVIEKGRKFPGMDSRFPSITEPEPFALKLVSHLPKIQFRHPEKGAMNNHLAGLS